MSVINVTILTRKDKKDELAKVEQMEALIRQAAQQMRREVSVTVSSNMAEAANSSINVAMTPVVIINGNSAFAKEVPSLDKVKGFLISCGSGEMY